MISEITSAVNAAKSLFEIVKVNKGLAEYNEIIVAVSEVNTKLMGATAVALASQEKQAALSDRIRDLEKELMELKNWNREAKRYQLAELCSGVFYFAVKQDMENGEPPHKLCAACFNKKQKGYLQFSGMNGTISVYKCNLCDKTICDFSSVAALNR